MLNLKRSQRRSPRACSRETDRSEFLGRSNDWVRSDSDTSTASLLERNPGSSALGKWIQGQECADCSAEETEWIALPWGVPLCFLCARSHRKLDREVSRVQNVFQTDWTEKQVDRILSLGGTRSINTRLERYLERWRKPGQKCSTSTRTCFIRDKYEGMLFCDHEERKSAAVSNEDVKQLTQFVSKLAGRRRREIDYEMFTETLAMLVQDALRLEAFEDSCLKLFIRLGWESDGGYFSRTFSYDEILDLNEDLIDCGYASDRKSEVERKTYEKCRSPRKSRSSRSRRKGRSSRSPKPRENEEFHSYDDEKREVVRYKEGRYERGYDDEKREVVRRKEGRYEKYKYEDDEKREVVRSPKRRSSYKRRYADDEEVNRDDTDYFRIKIYDEALGFGIGQHRWGGVEVTWVKPNCEAWSCGIRKGDVIVAINREDIREIRSLNFVCELLDEGRPLSLRVKRVKRRSP